MFSKKQKMFAIHTELVANKADFVFNLEKDDIRYYNEPAVPKRDGGRFLYSAPPSLKEERQYIMEGSNDKI